MTAQPIVHHPLAYHIGPLAVTGFGIGILACFLIGQLVAQVELARRGHDPRPVSDMVLAAAFGGLLGAKVYYVLVLGQWHSAFSRGGFVYWGGLLGGTVCVLAVVAYTKFGALRIFDVGAPACAAAYAVGRTGCWAIGDDYGRPYSGWLATVFPDGSPPSTAGMLFQEFRIPMPSGANADTLLSVFPTQLLEVVLGLAMFGLLWRIRDHTHAEGWLFGVYCVVAGIERFAVEFLRAKDDRFFGALTVAQGIAVAFVLVGIVWMLALWRITPERRGIYSPDLNDVNEALD